MQAVAKLNLIRIVHTVIWIFFNVILFYLAWAVISGVIDQRVWIGIGLIVLEGLVLLIFKNHCPLTLVARRYSASEKSNFDIILPEWLARNNKLIYTSLFVGILIGLMIRLAC